MKIDKVESVVRMGEDAGYQHPLLFPQCFKRPISLYQEYIAYTYPKMFKKIRPKAKDENW